MFSWALRSAGIVPSAGSDAGRLDTEETKDASEEEDGVAAVGSSSSSSSSAQKNSDEPPEHAGPPGYKAKKEEGGGMQYKYRGDLLDGQGRLLGSRDSCSIKCSW